MHFFQTYCWLLQTLINNVLHPPFHKMQWFSRIIRKQQRTFWFETNKQKAIVNQMIGRKYSTVRASPQGFSDGGILPGYFITPSHNLTQNHHDCLHFVIPCCRPAKNHHTYYRLSSSSILFYMLFFPTKIQQYASFGSKKKGMTYNEIKFLLYFLPRWSDKSPYCFRRVC